MSNNLIINYTPEEVSIALLADKKLVELNEEKNDSEFNVGDYYLGRVSRVVQNLNAAFVDVGFEKDAFLHYLDLGPGIHSLNKYVKETISGKQKSSNLMYFKYEKEIQKDGKITDVLKPGQRVLVKIAKEPISQKGPRLSCELSLPGRYLVLVPFSSKISVSGRVRTNQERKRLFNLIRSIQPKNFGVIVRTAAENKKAAELDKELSSLVEMWNTIFMKIKNSTPPTRVLGEMNRTTTLIRDMVNKNFDFDEIHVDDSDYYDDIKQYFEKNLPDKKTELKFYKGRVPIFERFGISRQIKLLFGRNVPMESGAYLIIEHTEAMHVIDVNSGNNVSRQESQAEGALAVNIEAAEEIARQLRLRDIGGIIVIDFIDMYNREHKQILFKKLRAAMAKDKARHNVIPPSKIGLVQITRERVRPQIKIDTQETCPSCGGTGKIGPTIAIIDEIRVKLNNIVNLNQAPMPITINVHPFIAAYLNKGLFNSIFKDWKKNIHKKLKLNSLTSLKMLEYEFVDAANNVINKVAAPKEPVHSKKSNYKNNTKKMQVSNK